MKYMVSSQKRLDNTPLYSVHSDLDSFILHNEGDIDEKINEVETYLDILQQSNQSLNEELNNQNCDSPETQHHDRT